MTGETSTDTSAWTVDTLKAYVDAINRESDLRVDAALKAIDDHAAAMRIEMDRRYEDRFLGQEKAIAKAEAAAEKRFDSVNEFRSQLADQASTFMPRIESEQRHAQAAEKISDLTHRLDKNEGHDSGVSTSWAALATTGGLIVAALAIILRVILPT